MILTREGKFVKTSSAVPTTACFQWNQTIWLPRMPWATTIRQTGHDELHLRFHQAEKVIVRQSSNATEVPPPTFSTSGKPVHTARSQVCYHQRRLPMQPTSLLVDLSYRTTLEWHLGPPLARD